MRLVQINEAPAELLRETRANVLLPEPIKPARQRTGVRGAGPRKGSESLAHDSAKARP